MGAHYITELKEGDRVDRVFHVSDRQQRSTADNRPYARLTLCDRTGTIEAVRWSLTPAEWEALSGAYVHCRGAVEAYRGKPQICIDSLHGVDTPDNTRDFIRTIEGSQKAHWAELKTLVTSVGDPYLSRLLKSLFADAAFRDAYRFAPAAQKLHHSYRGGLLEHSLEVAGMCLGICEQKPELRRDLLLVGALLHDIGKIDEWRSDLPGFDHTIEGGLLGHLTLGMDLLSRTMAGIAGFPSTLRAALLHLVLSHHGKLEWGSPVLPAIPEALVLSNCDYMSAQMAYGYAVKEAGADGPFIRVDGWNGRLYVGEIELVSNASAVADPELERIFAEEPAPVADAPERPVLRIVAGGLDGEASLPEMMAVPILGAIAAGTPIDMQEHVEGYLAVPMRGRGDAGDFLLRVTGDSMRDAHILDGDLIRIHPLPSEPQEADVVAAVINGDVTVKRFHREAGRITLKAENPAYNDIPVQNTDDFRIHGKVVGLIRDYVA